MRRILILLAGLALAFGLSVGPASAAPTVVIHPGDNLQYGPGFTTYCTIGPVGTDSSGRLVAITAGHCATAGYNVYSPNPAEWESVGPIGTFEYISTDLAYRDYAVIVFDPAKVTLDADGPRGRVDSIYPGIPPNNTNVCQLGSSSGRKCGNVGFNDRGLLGTWAWHQAGDSGGPVVKNNTTQWLGIVTRTSFTWPPFISTSAVNILTDLNSHAPGSAGVGFTPTTN